MDEVESQRFVEEVHNGMEAEIEDNWEETGRPLIRIELVENMERKKDCRKEEEEAQSDNEAGIDPGGENDCGGDHPYCRNADDDCGCISDTACTTR